MPKPIIWSRLAESDIEKILDYLSEKWTNQVISEFLIEVDLLINKISFQPKLFPIIYKSLKVRKCVITKHNTIFYREKRDRIEILRIFDTRQDPELLKFK